MRLRLVIALIGFHGALLFILLMDDGAEPFVSPSQAIESTTSISPPSAPALGAQPRSTGTREAIPMSDPSGFQGGTRTLHVHLTFLQSGSWNAEPHPGVPFEVGMGLWRYGSRNEYDVEERVILQTGTSDAKGEAEFDIEIPEEAFSRLEQDWLGIWGRVMAPGFQQADRMVCLPEEHTEGVTLRIVPKSGITLRGRVLGPTGDGVERAQVTRYETKSSGEIRSVKGVRTDRSGHFQMSVSSGGTQTFFATREGFGTARLQDVTWDIKNPPQDLELVLKGEGVLAGQLLDPVGGPIRQHELRAHLEVDYESLPYGDREQARVLADLSNFGTTQLSVQTDNDGRFRFGGLRPGSYKIYGSKPIRYEGGILLTPTPVSTGDEELALRLSRSALIVQVLDPSGERLRVEGMRDPSIRTYTYPKGLFPPEDLPLPALFCQQADTRGRIIPGSRYSSGAYTNGALGEFFFEVEHGKTYAFGVVSPGASPQEEVVTIAPGAWETHRTIQLAPPKAPSHLSVTIHSAAGVPITGPCQVRVIGLRTGVIVTGSDEDFHGPRFDSPVAAGAYLLQVDAEPTRGIHGGRNEKDAYAPVEQRISLQPGKDLDLVVRLGDGGYLALLVTADGEPNYENWPVPDQEGQIYDATRKEIRGSRVELIAEADGNKVVPTFPFSPKVGRSYHTSWIRPGKSQTAPEFIPVGRYLLRVHAYGYEPSEQYITIDGGQTTSVAVTIQSGPAQ